MSDDYNDLDINNENEEGATPPPSSGNNRTFLIAAGILGLIFILALVGLVIFAINRFGGGSQAARVAQINATNTAAVQALTQTSVASTRIALANLPTSTPLAPTATLRPSSTPVLVVATTEVVASGLSQDDARTATVAALLTQAAGAQLTSTLLGPTSTALPTTGFADEVGLPGLFGLGLVLLAVIFITRRLRTA
jgi:hypothetical protein